MPNMGGQLGRGGRSKPSLETLSVDFSNTLTRSLYAAYPMTENGRIFHNAVKANEPNRKLTMAAATVVGPGLFGGPGLTCSATTTYVNTPLVSDFDLFTKFSIVLWARFNNVGAISELVWRSQDGTSSGFEFMLSAAAHLQLIGYHSTPTLVTGASTLVTGQIYCLALTYDSTAGQSKLYVNGKLDVTGAGNIINSDGGDQLAIGGSNGISANFMRGTIDNPMFWSRTLSQAEIMRLVQNPFEIYNYAGPKTNINTVPLQSSNVPMIVSGPLVSSGNVPLFENYINPNQVQMRAISKANGPTSTKIFLPAGCTNGDQLCTIIIWDDIAGNIPATASGWTLKQTQTTGSVGMAMYTKTASGEPANITWTTGSDTIGFEYCIMNAGAPDAYSTTTGASTATVNLPPASHFIIGAWAETTQAGISAPLTMTDSGFVSRTSTNPIGGDSAFTVVTAPGTSAVYTAAGTPGLAQMITFPQTNQSQNQPLYLSGPQPISGNVPLYVLPALAKPSSVPLVVPAANMGSSGVPLFACVANINSGNVPLYMLSDSAITGTPPLFMTAVGFVPQAVPLYTANVAVNSGTPPLFVWGNSVASGKPPLYILGPTSSTGTPPLYTAGSVGNQNFLGIPLIVMSKLTASLPITLVLRVLDPLTSASLNPPFPPLFTLGSTPGVNSFYKASPLYMEASHGQQPTLNVPLFMLVPTVGVSTRNIPLFMKVDAWLGTIFNTAPLYINVNGASKSVPLTVSGLGTTPGAFPINLGTPLFIQRGANAVGGTPPLYVQCLKPFISGIPLFLLANPIINSGVPLAMPATKGLQPLTMPISVNGY